MIHVSEHLEALLEECAQLSRIAFLRHLLHTLRILLATHSLREITTPKPTRCVTIERGLCERGAVLVILWIGCDVGS